MKKALGTSIGLIVLSLTAFSQNNKDFLKEPSLGLHFFLNDFSTPASIRSTSLSKVVRDKKFAKPKDMTPGLAVGYLQGITNKVDFSSTLAASFLDYPFDNGKASSGDEALLLEADASLHAKMFDDHNVVNPYVSVGLGASKFKGYYGAIIPVGLGIQVNFFDEAFLLLNAQYRMKVSESTNYHLMYSLGFTGNIGSRKRRTE